MPKWIIRITVIVLSGGLFWYLFLMEYDYRVSFKARTFPGTINQTIKSWNASLEGSTIVSQASLNTLTQQLKVNDSLHEYRWEISPINDSLSGIRVYAKDLENSFKNRLLIPFIDTGFEKRTRQNLLDFNEVLKDHLKKFRVKIEGEAFLDSAFCAYVEVNGHQFDKARGMMYNSPLLGSVLVENQVPLDGQPFLELTRWDMENDSISYNFCYPIKQVGNLPEHPEILYKRFAGTRALKAIYNGNYITSDRAWYALLDYAKAKNIAVTGLPVEIFRNNPNMGGDEMQWTAEIYMPIKD